MNKFYWTYGSKSLKQRTMKGQALGQENNIIHHLPNNPRFSTTLHAKSAFHKT